MLPQTISSDTDQPWRVLSKQIISNNEKVGVLTVASFNPQASQLSSIDALLEKNANDILSRISVTNGVISTKNLDIRGISYDVVFQIVDHYNRIITKTDNTNSIDRIPNFIDTSYIGNMLQGQQLQEVTDTISNEHFLIYTLPIRDNQQYVIGVIVVGKSIAFITTILRDYIIIEGIFGIALACIATYLVWKAALSLANHSSIAIRQKPKIHHISFDKKTAILSLDNTMVQLPYATNQYYLCAALFSAPKKRWELDELLEKFGEVDNTNRRKVYDAMHLVNKRTVKFLDEKLIIIKEKTYQLNPALTPKIT